MSAPVRLDRRGQGVQRVSDRRMHAFAQFTVSGRTVIPLYLQLFGFIRLNSKALLDCSSDVLATPRQYANGNGSAVLKRDQFGLFAANIQESTFAGGLMAEMAAGQRPQRELRTDSAAGKEF